MTGDPAAVTEPARFGDLRLWRDQFRPGVLLPLREAPRTSGRDTDPSGIEVEAKRRVKAVVVRNLAGSRPAELLPQALDSANRGLDLLCASGVAPMVIADPDLLNLCWWEGADSARCMRVACRVRSQARLTVGGGIPDAGDPGNLILAPTSTTWDPALRYFRLSQVTDDLFDAFRNLYLAVESAFDASFPRPNGMGEGDWLLAALRNAASQGVNLNLYAPPGARSAERRLYKEIWTDIRNAVFHAKGSQARFVPLDASKRPAVLDAHRRLGALFMDLAGREWGVRFLSSGMGVAAIDAMAAGFLSDTQITLSSTRASIDARGNVSVTEGTKVTSTSRRAPELDDDRTRFVVASFDEQQLAVMPSVASLILTKDHAIYAFDDFDGSTVTLDSVDRLEVAFGVEIHGVSLRSSYPS